MSDEENMIPIFNSLYPVILNRIDQYGEFLETQREELDEIRRESEVLDAEMEQSAENLGELQKEIGKYGNKLEKQGRLIERSGEAIRENGVKIKELGNGIDEYKQQIELGKKKARELDALFLYQQYLLGILLKIEENVKKKEAMALADPSPNSSQQFVYSDPQRNVAASAEITPSAQFFSAQQTPHPFSSSRAPLSPHSQPGLIEERVSSSFMTQVWGGMKSVFEGIVSVGKRFMNWCRCCFLNRSEF